MPFVVDGFGFGKNWFLGATALIGLLLWVIDLLVGKKNEVKTSWPFWVGMVFIVWAGVTFFRLSMGGQMRSMMEPLGMGNILGLLIWVFLWLQVSDKDEYKKQLSLLTVSGLITGVVSLIVFVLPASKLPLSITKENPILTITNGFSLTGSLLAEGVLMLFLAVEWTKRLLAKLKDKDSVGVYLKEAIATAFFGLILFLDIYKIFKLGWVVLDGYSAWVIAVETLKRVPVFGMGIGNFIEGFNLFRPASYNLGQYWSTAFNGSSMGILNIWTETGVVGLMLTLWFVSGVLKKRKNTGFSQVALLLVIFLFLPLTPMTVFLFAWVVANRLFEVKESKLILNVGEKNVNVMPTIVSVLVFVAVVAGGYWWSKLIIGEVYYRQSLLAASKNDGANTYSLQIKAIAVNPYYAEYRKTYSQTNLAIAQTLLNNEDISDEDKEKASTLIQQSVREAKSAISLEGRNSTYWSNLAVIYKALIGLVDGSADWSFQAYQQAVALDPVNPLLSLDMGGLLFAAGNYDDADRVFEQVVSNKNNYANAWYNWAHTAKNREKLDLAVSRLEQAVKLVAADSGDYETANKELTEWKTQLEHINKQLELQQKQQEEAAKEKKPETLKTADPIPTMGEEEKVNVPASDLQPPTPTTAPTNTQSSEQTEEDTRTMTLPEN